MPTYEYQCETCGAEFEYFQPITAEKLTLCPESLCAAETKGAGKVARKISGGAGLVFNGDGFYLTDYVHKAGDKTAKTAQNGSATSSSEGAATKSAESSASSAASGANSTSTPPPASK
jgi:putative FmdB family regulatory protein